MGRKLDFFRCVRFGLAAVLLASVGLYAWRSRAWPLVNDPALMHYVVLLMDRGLAPYRDIGDINLPGAWAAEWASLRLAALLHAPLAAVWRAMDWLALALAGSAMVAITGRRRWFAGLWAASLFALAHGAQGIGQAGQRDLWMTVPLLWGIFWALRARASSGWGWAAFAGLAIGAAATVKPFAIFWLLIPLLLARRQAFAAVCAFLLPPAYAAAYLASRHGLAAFGRVIRVDLPYHARLGAASLAHRLAVLAAGRPWRLLLLGLGFCWVLALLLRVRTLLPERRILWASAGFGLVSYLAQGKGYPYQVYPCTAFLLLAMALEFDAVARSPRRALAAAGAAGLLFGALGADRSWLRAASRAGWPIPVTAAMEDALRPFGDGRLQGSVQCIDSVSGCTDALLHLGLKEATGNLYDEFLFPQTPSPWGAPYSGPAPGAPTPPAVAAAQERFRAQILAHPPRAFLVTAWLFPQGPGSYRKLPLWPWFDRFLKEHYRLAEEKDYPRAENGPMGFRVYLRQ